jgi:hypothetical protein
VKERTSVTNSELAEALHTLRDALNAGTVADTCCINAKDTRAFINIFIVFDEAHTLTRSHDNQESRFVTLRQVLNSLGTLPLYSFFLLTTGKVTQFGPSHSQDESGRIYDGELTSPRPYVFVGFDQLAGSYKFREGQTLQHVTSLKFTAHLGRPL